MKKTLILGASSNPERYSNMAARRLSIHNHEIVLVGINEGKINDEPIRTDRPQATDVHTITLYIAPKNQPEWESYVFEINPERVIFNPGTENDKFADLLKNKNIEVVYGCTLVMLGIGTY